MQPTPVAFHAGTAVSLGTTGLVGIRREQAIVSRISRHTWDGVHASPALGWRWAGERYPLLHKAWKDRVANYAFFWYKFEVIQ